MTREERRTWDAETYRRIAAPQQRWGSAILAGIDLRGDETVIDAGCGAGNLTRLIAEAVPRGRVIALDVSPAMLEVARRELADLGPRVEILQADLGDLALDQEADLIFSGATFHWVLDQDALYTNLFRALRPGGRLHAQCGGTGNLARISASAEALVRERWPAAVEGWSYPAYFPGVDETRARMEKAGFEEIDVGLSEAPTTFDGGEAFREFIQTVILTPLLGRLPSDGARQEALDTLTAEAGRGSDPYTLDYVRLNVRAARPR
jgi:trans-aconitate 2-methyltransferase